MIRKIVPIEMKMLQKCTDGERLYFIFEIYLNVFKNSVTLKNFLQKFIRIRYKLYKTEIKITDKLKIND